MIGQSWIGVMMQLTGVRLAVYDAVLCSGCSTVAEIDGACRGYREQERSGAWVWLMAHFLLSVRRDGVVGVCGRTTREAELQWLANGGRPLDVSEDFISRGPGGRRNQNNEESCHSEKPSAAVPARDFRSSEPRAVHDYQPQFFANV